MSPKSSVVVVLPRSPHTTRPQPLTMCFAHRMTRTSSATHISPTRLPKLLSLKQVKQLDLNEVERRALQTAILEIDEDFREDKFAYLLRLVFIKNCKQEEVTNIGWSGAMITAKSHNNAINSLLVKYQFGYYWLFPLADNLDKTYFRVMLNDFHILLPDNVINIGRRCSWMPSFTLPRYRDSICSGISQVFRTRPP